MKTIHIAYVFLVLSAVGATRQGPRLPPMSKHPIGSEVVDRIGPEEIQDIVHSVAPDSRGAILPMSIDGQAQYILNIRREASEAERHDNWDDVLIIQHGYGHLDYGHAIKGGARYGAGEWRGGQLSGELTTLDLAPGVVIRIPASVPHVVRPAGSIPLVYLVLKEKVIGGRPARQSR